MAGFEDELKVTKWTKSGYLEGPNRNVAWRVIDAKYFGLPQQRKRLYVLAGGKDFRPDNILFEFGNVNVTKSLKSSNKANEKFDMFNLFPQENLENSIGSENVFYKGSSKFEIFRDYTDCLYSAYGTKWNGNAAAYNGSLYISQDDKIRRFTPLECERLMGLPDNYTRIYGSSDTNRYQAIGNSWAVPVVKWIGKKLNDYINNTHDLNPIDWLKSAKKTLNNLNANLFLINSVYPFSQNLYLNSSTTPNTPQESNLIDLVAVDNIPEKFYLSKQACNGILRRKEEKDIRMNLQLEKLMRTISLQTGVYELA